MQQLLFRVNMLEKYFSTVYKTTDKTRQLIVLSTLATLRDKLLIKMHNDTMTQTRKK